MSNLSTTELVSRLMHEYSKVEHYNKKGWYNIASKQWDVIHAIEKELSTRG
jgi:hypothetical protein